MDKTEQRIISILKKSSQDLTIDDISQKIGMNRITISKYLAVMEARGKLKMRSIGKAKLYQLKGR
jgi:response regulator of citrate/malate metabolism